VCFLLLLAFPKVKIIAFLSSKVFLLQTVAEFPKKTDALSNGEQTASEEAFEEIIKKKNSFSFSFL
jgi:hypothetical protein